MFCGCATEGDTCASTGRAAELHVPHLRMKRRMKHPIDLNVFLKMKINIRNDEN